MRKANKMIVGEKCGILKVVYLYEYGFTLNVKMNKRKEQLNGRKNF